MLNTDAGAVIALDAETGRRVWSYRYTQRPSKNIGADLMRVDRDLAPCVAAYEREAFRVQLKWLSEQGVSDPHAFLGINDMAVFVRSLCPYY